MKEVLLTIVHNKFKITNNINALHAYLFQKIKRALFARARLVGFAMIS
jgi:hypothetical protein